MSDLDMPEMDDLFPDDNDLFPDESPLPPQTSPRLSKIAQESSALDMDELRGAVGVTPSAKPKDAPKPKASAPPARASQVPSDPDMPDMDELFAGQEVYSDSSLFSPSAREALPRVYLIAGGAIGGLIVVLIVYALREFFGFMGALLLGSFGVYGLVVTTAAAILGYRSQRYREWLYNQHGFRARLGRAPRFNYDTPNELLKWTLIYFIPPTILGLILLSLAMGNAGFTLRFGVVLMSAIFGLIIMVPLYSWLIEGWRLPPESSDEREAAAERAAELAAVPAAPIQFGAMKGRFAEMQAARAASAVAKAEAKAANAAASETAPAASASAVSASGSPAFAFDMDDEIPNPDDWDFMPNSPVAIAPAPTPAAKPKPAVPKPQITPQAAALPAALSAASNLQAVKTPAQMAALSPADFERFVGQLFKKQGYEVKRLNKPEEKNVQLIVRKDGVTSVVRCIAPKGGYDVQSARDLHAASMRYKAEMGLLVSNSDISMAVQIWAEDKPLRLIDGRTLASWANG